MERILYNGFASATATGGTRFFYVNPLQRRADHFEKDDRGRRREWFSCACCPPNIMRLTASLPHYLATVAGDTLFVHLFADSSLAGGELAVRVDTGYPWSGAAEIRVSSAPVGPAGLAVRVLAWSRRPRLISGKVGSGVPWRRQTGATGRWCNTPASSIPSGWF